MNSISKLCQDFSQTVSNRNRDRSFQSLIVLQHTQTYTTIMNNKIAFATMAIQILCLQQQLQTIEGLSTKQPSRREALGSILGGGATVFLSQPSNAVETTDVDSFLRSGGVSMPMGVSGQAGKAKPETGVLLREGTEISRDSKSGNVLAEILVQKNASGEDNLMAVVASFQSPWPLGMSPYY